MIGVEAVRILVRATLTQEEQLRLPLRREVVSVAIANRDVAITAVLLLAFLGARRPRRYR